LATDDQKTLASHIGRCKGFVMVEVEDGQVGKQWYVENTFSHAHYHRGHHNHDDAQEHGYGNHHQTLLDLLQGVNYVVSRGMGRRLYEDLLHHGLVPFLTKEVYLDRVIQGILDGSIQNDGMSGCCQH
ncbi:MAG: NifB/NifX family molybdenum-iron cluster-binding protein, partial [Brevinematales bacterium]